MAKLIITITDHRTENPSIVGFETHTKYDDSDGRPSAILEYLHDGPILSAAIHAAISVCLGPQVMEGFGPITEDAKALVVTQVEKGQFPSEL
jgi:hypothetical protein